MKRFVLAVLATIACTGLAHAQATLKIQRTDISQFPSIELRIEVSRDGKLLRNFSRTDFSVLENGIPQVIDDLSCPQDSFTRFSIGILIDRSRSMTLIGPNQGALDPDSTEIKSAKHAVSDFLGFLSDHDEAMIASFSSDYDNDTNMSVFYQVDQGFTYDTALLRRALVPIAAFGGTWLWRAITQSLDLLAPRTGKRLLIVLTDGQDKDDGPNNWDYTTSSVITKARLLKIPIYTIGLGDEIDEISLSSVANATGGVYTKSPDESTLESVFRALANKIMTDACLLRYTSKNPCLDGGTRHLDVSVHTSGVQADDTTSYSLPNGLLPATLALPAALEIPAKTTVNVPILLAETVSRTRPLSYTVTVHHNPAVLQFIGVNTTGTISQSAAVQAVESPPGTVLVTMSGQTPAMTGGALFSLDYFALGRPDTGRTPITLSDAWVYQVCPMNVTTTGSSVVVIPCSASFALSVVTMPPILNGEDVTVPVRIDPPMAPGVQFDLSFAVKYDPARLTFLDLNTRGTLAAQCTPVATGSNGRVRLQMTGVPPIRPPCLPGSDSAPSRPMMCR